MEEKKISISLSSFIALIIVILGIFILITSIVFKNLKANNTTSINDSNNKQNETLSENTNQKTEENTNNQETNNSSSVQNSITGKRSTKRNPLSIGEWGIASKYSDSKYIDTPVRVTNIIRGTDAAQKVKDFCNKSSYYQYSEPKSNMEWIVVEYQVDLTNIKDYSIGKSISINSDIIGTGSGNAIQYNGYSYLISTTDMSENYSKENIATGYFTTTLPIGCSDYLIKFGPYTDDYTNAYFKGK